LPASTVIASSRVHMGLIDLSKTTYRIFGGIGFAVGPSTVVRAKPAQAISVSSRVDIDDRDFQDVRAALHRLCARDSQSGVAVEVLSRPPVHVGLGTKTALILASLAASAFVLDREPSKQLLQTLSRRGGTSGIGIHTFFSGGIVIDAGHPGFGRTELLPSSMHAPDSPPPCVVQVQGPPQWVVTLALPPGKRVAGGAERTFFLRETPIPPDESLRTLALVYHGCLPAILNADLDTLGAAVTEISQVGFKAREIDSQPAAVQQLLTRLRAECPVVGMSSMGPLLYMIDRRGHAETVLRLDGSVEVLGEFRIENNGYEVHGG
jgi:beta-ribofuranosylaminobenzene 5'-phosphate synthase